MKVDKKKALEVYRKDFLGHEFSADPNTWDWVKGVRSEIQTDTSNYPWREAWEELWSEVTKIQHDDYMGFSREDEIGDTPFEALDTCIEASRYPPIEVLIALNEALKIYFWGQGKLTLEDVFFGPEKKGIGNYSARKARSKVYKDFEMFLMFDHFGLGGKDSRRARDKSLIDKAEEFLAYGKNPLGSAFSDIQPDFEGIVDPESFLRGYKRWVKSGRTYEASRTTK